MEHYKYLINNCKYIYDKYNIHIIYITYTYKTKCNI